MTAQTPDECFYNGKTYFPFFAKRYYTKKPILSFLTCDWDNPMMGDWDIPKSNIFCTNLHRNRVGLFELQDDLKLRIHAITACEKSLDDNQWVEWKDNRKELYKSFSKERNSKPLFPGMFDYEVGNVFKRPTYIDYKIIYLYDNPLYYSIDLYRTKTVLEVIPEMIKEIENPYYDPRYGQAIQEKKRNFWDKVKAVFR